VVGVAAVAEVLVDAFGRVREAVHEAVHGLDVADLAFRADPAANSVGWLVWHLTRIEDDHLAAAAGTEQVWTAGGWLGRFGLPFDPAATGYGQGPDDVAAVQAPAALLAGYHDAVHEQAVGYVGGLQDADLDRVVDVRWDPPVTLGVRLVSVLADALQHAGQAAFVRGIVARRP
jgi:hypothetical protein